MANGQAADVIMAFADRLATIPGKKALQKLMYFVQEAEGTHLGLSFDMHHYGPYSQDLEWVLRDMEANRQLAISYSGDTYEMRPLVSGYRSSVVDAVLEKLGTRRPRELELLASLHFLAKLRPYLGSEADKSELRTRLKLWKGTKFSESEVSQAIYRLESADYLSTTI